MVRPPPAGRQPRAPAAIAVPRPARNVRSHVAFRNHIPHFIGENGHFAGFWPSIGPVYYGTITGTGPDCPARKNKWPRECKRTRGAWSASFLGASVPWPL